MARIPTSKVGEYLKKIEKHFPDLVEEGKMSKNSRDSFFEDFIGCNKRSYKSWYASGIRRVYHILLWCLDEIKRLKDEIKQLKK